MFTCNLLFFTCSFLLVVLQNDSKLLDLCVLLLQRLSQRLHLPLARFQFARHILELFLFLIRQFTHILQVHVHV